MKLLKGVMLAAAMAAGAASFSADAIGWPANYEGVMLQVFTGTAGMSPAGANWRLSPTN